MHMLRTFFLIFVLSGVSGQKHYRCDFEQGRICSFLTNSPGNEENWKIGRGKLNPEDTGPSVDHTTGTANGTYLFVNATQTTKANSVSLETVVIKKDYCVRFFYHMHGADVGSLTVSAQSVSQVADTKTFFYKTWMQGDRWKEAVLSVTEEKTMMPKGYRIIFRVKHGITNSVLGDIALDDIELSPGKCEDTKSDVTQLCTFDDNDCGYKSSGKEEPSSLPPSSLQWVRKSQNGKSEYFEILPDTNQLLGNQFGGYWFFGAKEANFSYFQKDMLVSPVYGKTKETQNCLQFYYYRDDSGRDSNSYLMPVLYRPAFKYGLNSLTMINGKKNLKRWNYAEFEVDIYDDFQIQFRAGLTTGTEVVIAVDDIKLIPGKCPEAGFCDFEEYKCKWQIGYEKCPWVHQSGRSSKGGEIGPSIDNTLKTADGSYVVFSTKNKKQCSAEDLESEIFPPNDEEMCLTFFYYMLGEDLGTLKVIKIENQIESTLWLLTNDQGDTWNRGMAVLEPSMFKYQVVFRVESGNETNGNIALDDIRIRTGEKCQLLPPEAGFKELCTSNPCLNGGTCIISGNSFKCVCRKPFFGKMCEEDPCTSNPCLNEGNCTLNENNFKCSCKEPFLGEKCEKALCSKFTFNQCYNGGNCTHINNKIQCTCKEPYFGDNCEKDLCTSNPCRNGGTCTMDNSTFKCSCRKPFFGDVCEKDPCSANPCFNGGVCNVDGNKFKCACSKPFFGDRCDEDPCTSTPCLNGGICSLNGNSYKCACKGSFAGDRCEEDRCTYTPCLNGGVCSIIEGQFKCSCRTPFFGWRCQEDPCSSNPCLNDGVCNVSGISFTCSCQEPFFGDRCEEDPCTSTPCLNGGICSLNGNNYTCACNSSFSGDRCEKSPCSSNPCQNDGICSVNGSDFKCSCMTPFFGERCEEDPCSSNPCLNDGVCNVSGISFRCSCREPFFGDRCGEDPCSSSPCLNEGICRAEVNSFRCDCRDPFFGERCEQSICNDDVCVHGKCEITGRFYKCRCNEGYTGLRCEDTVQTKSDNQAVWQIIQASIMFFILILLAVIFCLQLKRRK